MYMSPLIVTTNGCDFCCACCILLNSELDVNVSSSLSRGPCQIATFGVHKVGAARRGTSLVIGIVNIFSLITALQLSNV